MQHEDYSTDDLFLNDDDDNNDNGYSEPTFEKPKAINVIDITSRKPAKQKAELKNGNRVNLLRILRKLDLCKNEFDGRTYFNAKELVDTDYTKIQVEIEVNYSLRYSKTDIIDYAALAASENMKNPVKEYLNYLKWDGVDRLNDVTKLLSPLKLELATTFLTKWLISSVARIMEPGAKADCVLIFKGDQGIGKSTFLSDLVFDRKYFSDAKLQVDSPKDCMTKLAGKWIYELAELSAMKKKEAESIKDFISRQVEEERKAYDRELTRQHRTCVFAGTTNNDEFLGDPTGSRRFWVIESGSMPIDTAYIREHRDQIWAQVMHLYNAGEQWWFTDNTIVEENNAAFQIKPLYWDKINEWISAYGNTPEEIKLTDLQTSLGVAERDKFYLVKALKMLGYKNKQVKQNGVNARLWVKG